MIPCLFVLGSCCWGDDGGYDSGTAQKDQRILRMADTTDTIFQIWYQQVPLILNPLRYYSQITLSENTNTTLYVQRKNQIDTIVLTFDISYNYYDGKCEGARVSKRMSNVPRVVSHTFNHVLIKDSIIPYRPNNIYSDFHQVIITLF